MRWARSVAQAAVASAALILVLSGSAQGATFHGSWVDRALDLQYRLSGDVGLRNAPFIGTHNSFNSVAEMGPTTATSDPNQQLSIVDQLKLDIRAIELDVHWTVTPSTGQLAPVVCHAFPNHFPCTTEKTLGQVLDEIGGWLRAPANSDQVLFLYLEDHLDDQTGYDAAAALIEQELGDVLYAPSAEGGCQQLPLELTRDQILAAGKRLIIVGNSPCGVGSAWPSLVFDWEDHLETGPATFSDFPSCGTDYTRARFESTQVRYFEDGRPSQAGPRITPQVAAEMARCGVDLLGLDQLAPNDPRLRALVWSWAKGQPGRGRCAVQAFRRGSLSTRWRTLACGKPRRPACRRGTTWILGAKAVPEKRARAECRSRRAQFAVPRTGFEAQLLRQRMQGSSTGQVWLGYVKRQGGWAALDRRSG